jgi:hypothetical protein
MLSCFRLCRDCVNCVICVCTSFLHVVGRPDCHLEPTKPHWQGFEIVSHEPQLLQRRHGLKTLDIRGKISNSYRRFNHTLAAFHTWIPMGKPVNLFPFRDSFFKASKRYKLSGIPSRSFPETSSSSS